MRARGRVCAIGPVFVAIFLLLLLHLLLLLALVVVALVVVAVVVIVVATIGVVAVVVVIAISRVRSFWLRMGDPIDYRWVEEMRDFYWEPLYPEDYPNFRRWWGYQYKLNYVVCGGVKVYLLWRRIQNFVFFLRGARAGELWDETPEPWYVHRSCVRGIVLW